MSILALQQRLVEVGRIRMGVKVATTNGKSRPKKLDTWRLTSPDEKRLHEVAQVYGGEVSPWEDQFEVTTSAAALDIAIIPGQALSQHLELWGQEVQKGPVVCLRRCDGQTELLTDKPCICQTEGGEDLACKPTTRLLVMLRRIAGIGAWRLDTKGWNAAQELYGVAGLLEGLTARGQVVPARLRLEQRKQTTRTGRKDFVVPVIDIDVALDHVLASTGMAGLGAGASAPAIARSFTPVPVSELAAPPSQSVAEQVADVGSGTSGPRANAAARIPATGARPRGQVIDIEHDDSDAEPPSSGPHPQRVAIAAREAGLDDDGRHDLAAWASQGRVRSSTELTLVEQNAALDAAAKIKAGSHRLAPKDDGTVSLVDTRFGFADQPTVSAEATPISEGQIAAMKGRELVAALQERGLPCGGKVDELRERLREALR